jgi:hypothetical protein
MKQVQLHELSRFSARFNTALQLEGSDLTVRYRGRVLNLESTDQGVTISGDKYEQKIFADEVASVFALSGKLILTLESGAIITLLNVKEKEAGDPTVNKGVKVLNANSAPKDPASRADQRKKAIAQGYSGVRYETEEGYEIDEDGKGIKVLPAEQQPKDPEDRKKKRAMYIAQGFDGVRYEGEEESGEGQDLVDSMVDSIYPSRNIFIALESMVLRKFSGSWEDALLSLYTHIRSIDPTVSDLWLSNPTRVSR